jgi:hypothetical protein
VLFLRQASILKRDVFWKTIMNQPIWWKRWLFALYLWWKHGPQDTPTHDPLTFIWKDVYFLLWHVFFWKMGRSLLGILLPVRPLLPTQSGDEDELTYDATTYARTDRDQRPLADKIIHTTRFPISEATTIACCRLIATLGRKAPWQYSVEARCEARRHMMYLCLCALALCFVFFPMDAPADSWVGWMRLVMLLGFLVGMAGWIADCALLRFAREAKRRNL